MQAHRKEERYQVTWLIRRLFRAMADNATDRLKELDVTAADRAVLEFLYPDERMTVPEIAARYHVSRQHVQVIANSLLANKLITSNPNPSHKRSSLLALTSKGKQLFGKIRQADQIVVDKIFSEIKLADVTTTRKTLQELLANLQ